MNMRNHLMAVAAIFLAALRSNANVSVMPSIHLPEQDSGSRPRLQRQGRSSLYSIMLLALLVMVGAGSVVASSTHALAEQLCPEGPCPPIPDPDPDPPPPGSSALLFYNQANRQLATGVLKSNGSFQTVQVFDPGTSLTWSHIAGGGNGAIVFYNQANRQLATGVVKSDGSFQTVRVFDPDTSSTWSHIAGAGNGAVFFYNQAERRYATGILEANGNFRTVFDSEPGVTGFWSHIAGRR